MRYTNLPDDGRTALLMHMVREFSKAPTTERLLEVFLKTMRRVDGGPAGYVGVSTIELEEGEYQLLRWFDPDGRARIPSARPMHRPIDRQIHRGGLIGRLIETPEPKLVGDLASADVEDPVLGRWADQFRSVMAAPVFTAGRIGAWAILFGHEVDRFSLEALEQLILRANLVGATVSHVRVQEDLRAAHARIEREVDRIAAIQRALLPERLPAIPGLTVAASYATYDRAGGDMYDLVPVGQDPEGLRWALLVGDASGHGPAAAVLMAMMHAFLRTCPRMQEGPAAVLEHANAHLCAKPIDNSFVTAFLAFFNPVDRRLTYACAGHHPPLLKGPAGGPVQRLDRTGSLPLGIAATTAFEEAQIQLQPEQTLLLYTDGITEARSPEGAMFGLQRLEESFGTYDGAPEELIRMLCLELQGFERGRRPTDDQTLVAIRITAPSTDTTGAVAGIP